jgi:F-type H+-transporting ATPase subunit delta
MEEKNTLARPYANAAFQQALEEGKLGEWSEMLTFLASMASEPTMSRIFQDPRIPKSRMIAMVLDIAEGRLSNTGQNFAKVLAENGRLFLIREIASLFED